MVKLTLNEPVLRLGELASVKKINNKEKILTYNFQLTDTIDVNIWSLVKTWFFSYLIFAGICLSVGFIIGLILSL